MNQRVERVAGEVRAILGDVLAREEIKDPRVRGVGLITITHVRVSGDLSHVKAMFTVYGLDATAMERVRAGLDHASGYFRQAIARRLRTRVSPAITFHVDEAFEKATRVEAMLRELAPPAPAKTSAAETDEAKPDGTEPDGDDDVPAPK